MIILNPIDAKQITETPNISELFPLAMEYLTSGKWGEEYWKDDYEWFVLTDDELDSDALRHTWLGLICVTEKRFEGGLHLSIFEVAKPIRRLGMGTKLLSKLIDVCLQNRYDILTLQIREPKLINFYKRFGFHPEVVNNATYYVLNL